ncbi:MAG: FapA family protein, partial [Ignavibacteria bacterium]|nr:FapA family protein [Ignavibacteria bacterium]
VATEIEVGIVMKYREQFLKKKAEKAETFRQMEELKKKISEIAQKPDSKAKNLQLLTIKDIWQRNVHQLQKLEKEVKEIEEAYYNVEKPVVIISKTVYPGTIISIKGKSFEVKEELNRVVFSLVDNVVSFKAAKV